MAEIFPRITSVSGPIKLIQQSYWVNWYSWLWCGNITSWSFIQSVRNFLTCVAQERCRVWSCLFFPEIYSVIVTIHLPKELKIEWLWTITANSFACLSLQFSIFFLAIYIYARIELISFLQVLIFLQCSGIFRPSRYPSELKIIASWSPRLMTQSSEGAKPKAQPRKTLSVLLSHFLKTSICAGFSQKAP